MKKLAISVAALLALSSLAVNAQEGKRGDQGGGQQQAPAAAQPSPVAAGCVAVARCAAAVKCVAGGMMQQRQARPDAGMQRGQRMGGDMPRIAAAAGHAAPDDARRP